MATGKTDNILFLNIDTAVCPTVVASFIVSHDLHVQIFDAKVQLDITGLDWLLGKESKLSR